MTLVLSDVANEGYRQTNLGQGQTEGGSEYGSAYFLKYHSGGSTGFFNHRVCQSGSDSKALCRGTFFSSKNTKQLRNYLAKINIYITYI